MFVADPHQINVWTHIAAGAVALAVGLVPLFSRKGGPLHRWSGRVTAGLGVLVLGSATLATLLFNPPAPLMAATLSAGYQYLSGLRTLMLNRRGPGLPDALLALAGLGLSALILFQMGQGSTSWSPAFGYATIGFLSAITLYDLSRFFWISTWYRNVRSLDHGVKMIGFYFAMLSAGAGNLLAELQPLSQILPSVMGMVALIGFVIWYSLHPINKRPSNATA